MACTDPRSLPQCSERPRRSGRFRPYGNGLGSGAVAAQVGRPAESLMLTSGGGVLDLRGPLLEQVTNDEVTYVAQRFGAGRAAVSLEKTLAKKAFNPADVCAANEVVSLTFGWDFNQSMVPCKR